MMPRVKRLLKDASVEVASRRRICHHNRSGHEIHKGDACLVVKEPEGGKRNYCELCAMEILDQVADDLDTLRAALS